MEINVEKNNSSAQGKIKVLFVCLGNICRSPLAEAVFNKKVEEKGLAQFFEADSAGTSNYHIGSQPDKRTIQNAEKNAVKISHSARQIATPDLRNFDYVLAMDAENMERINTLAEVDAQIEGKIFLMRDFEPGAHPGFTTNEEQPYTNRNSLSESSDDPLTPDRDVPDPYFGGEDGFQEVFDILDRTVENFIQYVVRERKLA